MTKNWRTATCTPDRQGSQVEMTRPVDDGNATDKRRGVRRTVNILVAVVIGFYLLAFLQILLMK
jgi:hypothetical protein